MASGSRWLRWLKTPSSGSGRDTSWQTILLSRGSRVRAPSPAPDAISSASNHSFSGGLGPRLICGRPKLPLPRAICPASLCNRARSPGHNRSTRAQLRSNAPRDNGSIRPGHKPNAQSTCLRPRIQVGSDAFSRCSLIEKGQLSGVWGFELLSPLFEVFALDGGGARPGFFVANL